MAPMTLIHMTLEWVAWNLANVLEYMLRATARVVMKSWIPTIEKTLVTNLLRALWVRGAFSQKATPVRGKKLFE